MNDECMELLPDTPEKIYNGLLYPSEEKIAEIATNAKFQFLRENNFDFNESYPVVFCSSFRDKQGAEAYIGHIKKLYNLERCVIYDHTDSESEDDLPLSYPIGAYFQVSEVLTRELLCIQCSVIIRIADKYGGKFDIWELGEIQEREDVGN